MGTLRKRKAGCKIFDADLWQDPARWTLDFNLNRLNSLQRKITPTYDADLMAESLSCQCCATSSNDPRLRSGVKLSEFGFDLGWCDGCDMTRFMHKLNDLCNLMQFMDVSHDVSGMFWIMFWRHKRLAKWSCECTRALQSIDLGIFWPSFSTFSTTIFKAKDKTRGPTGFSVSPVCNLRWNNWLKMAQVLALRGRIWVLPCTNRFNYRIITESFSISCYTEKRNNVAAIDMEQRYGLLSPDQGF